MSFETLEIKAHNNNGSFRDHCFNLIMRKSNEDKIKVLNKNKKLIRENNSCINNSLCKC